MKKLSILCTCLVACLTNSAIAEPTHSLVTVFNNSPKLGQMIITYEVIRSDSGEQLKPNSPSTLYVDKSALIDLGTPGSGWVTIIPIAVNGHTIVESAEIPLMVKKADACAVTLDENHLGAKLLFTEVTKAKGSSYITCSTQGGITS